MRIKNIIITIVMLSLAGYGGLKLYLWNEAKQNVDLIFNGINQAMTSAYDSRVVATYNQISTSVFGSIGIKGISIRFPELNEEIKVAEIKLLESDLDSELKKGKLPTRVHFVINGLQMNVSLFDKLDRKLDKIKIQQNIKEDPNALVNRLGYQNIVRRSNDLMRLGYSKMDMDLEIDMNLDMKSNEASLYLRQDIKDMGKYKVMLKFSGISDNIDKAVLGLRIKEAKLEFLDKSYVDRIIQSYADDNNMTLSAYRNKLIGKIKKDFINKEMKLSKSSINNILAFVKKPNKIVFTIYPYRPVAIESLKHYKAGDVPGLLNLQAHLK